MLMTAADLKPGEYTSLYKVKETIRTAYVDPLVPGYQFGAVYVDTKFPIKVEKVKSNTVKESVDDSLPEDTPVFTSMEEFTNYYGLELVDDENENQVVEESLKSKIGVLERLHNEKKFINKKWKFHRLISSDKEVIKILKPKEFTNVTNWFSAVKTTKDENVYKKAFDKLCRVFNLGNSSEVNIKNIEFDNENFMCRLIYSIGKQKFIIPNGYTLIYKTMKQDVTELKPRLYQKFNGAFVYPSYRIYMQIVSVDKAKGNNIYVPKEHIRSVFIDTDTTSFNKQYAYIETRFPIKLKKIDK